MRKYQAKVFKYLFGLRKYYHIREVDFIDQKLFEYGITVIFDKFSSIKYLSITKDLVDDKLWVNAKLLLDAKLSSVCEYPADRLLNI